MSSQIASKDDAERDVSELGSDVERLQAFIEASSDWFFEMDRDLRFTYLSGRFQEVTGVSPDEVIGKTPMGANPHRRIHEEEDKWQQQLATMKAHRSWNDFTYTLVRDDGENRVLNISAKAFVDQNGEFAGYRGVGSDVTDRARSETRLSSIIDAVPDAIITIDEYGLINSFSRAAENLFGHSETDVIGQNVKMLMPNPFRDEHDGYIDHFKATGEKKIIGIGRDVEGQRKDGSVFPMHLSVNEMLVDGRQMFTGIVHDTTDLKRAQRLSNRVAEILDRSLNEIYLVDAETLSFVRVNFGARRNTGYSSKEFRQMTPADISPDFSASRFAERVEPLRTGSKELLVYQTSHRRKDGSTYPVEVHLQLMQYEVQPVYLAVVQDITLRQQQQETLLLRDRAIESVETGVLITDALQEDNSIIFANQAMEKITGYTASEMMGRDPRFLQGEENDQAELDEIRTALNNEAPVHVTLRNYRKDGTRFMNEVKISPVRDDAGKLTHYIGVHSDVSAKLDTEARLRQSQKMEAIGQLTGGIAHDFNNLLTVVIGNHELLADRLSEDEISGSLLDDAIDAAQSGAKLTGQLLSFARQQSLDPKSIDLNELVQDMFDMLDRTLGETIKIRTKLASDLGKALADPAQLHNVLLNLSINARDAMPDGGELTIETSNVELDATMANERVDVDPGRYVRISIGDTGVGMSPEVRDRVLEPFFTTKELGKGTGLGLSMVHGFAKQSGGHLEVYSELGHGTTMSLYLPNVDASADENDQKKPSASLPTAGSETVLVVEDDPRVRKITVKRLEHLGYNIIEAETGQQALDMLDASAAIDVVFTDMIMPGEMTGAELLEKVRVKYPKIKLMITSGYAEDGTLPADSTPWLRKPYSLQEMATAFSDLLDGSK